MASSCGQVRAAAERLSDDALVASRERHVARMRAVYDGDAVNWPVIVCGRYGGAKTKLADDPEQWFTEVLADLAAGCDALLDEEVYRPLIVACGPYGVHYIDKILGADVFDLDGTDNWQVHPLPTPVGGLRPPDLQADPTWKLSRQAAELFVEASAAAACFCTPCLSGPLNTAVNLYGGEFLAAMLESPEAARRDLRVITDVIVALHRWYIENVPADQLQAVAAGTRVRPPGFGHVCGCSTQLLSGELYRDIVAPFEDEVLALYPGGGMVHICGTHTQHIPVWREMKSVKIVQVNDRASVDLPQYLDELREDQILYSHECPDMPALKALRITAGRRLVLSAIPSDVESVRKQCRQWRAES